MLGEISSMGGSNSTPCKFSKFFHAMDSHLNHSGLLHTLPVIVISYMHGTVEDLMERIIHILFKLHVLLENS